MYWILIGDYSAHIVEAEDFDDLQRASDSDRYHTVVRLDAEAIKDIKEDIDRILT